MYLAMFTPGTFFFGTILTILILVHVIRVCQSEVLITFYYSPVVIHIFIL